MTIPNTPTQDEALKERADCGLASDVPSARRRVLVLGATGTVGRATVRELVERGHDAVCLIREGAGGSGGLHPGAIVRVGDPTSSLSLSRDGICGERFDGLITCLASRTGSPQDAWAIDYAAQMEALAAAREEDIPHFILLSAICVQKPRLEFQRAKLAFEQALMASGLTYSIVRPTAFFKSLSGQIDRVRKGKPFLVFGNGRLTACKPISDNDLARYLVDCLDDGTRHNRVLPIGGPGAAITPREQGEALFRLLGREPRFRQVRVGMLDAIVALLGTMGRVVPRLAGKAELARIGRYYATESMLVLNSETGVYDAAATPSTGSDTLFDFYRRVLAGEDVVERGEHAVF